MIKEIIGDVLDKDLGCDIIAHQTNCIGVMGAGVALQIKRKMLTHEEYSKYTSVCKNNNAEELLGTFQILNSIDGRKIANVFGENIPTRDKIDTNYEALRKALEDLHDYANCTGESIAMPGLLGCGLAGGDWNIVRNMIEEIFGDSKVDLTIVFFLEEDYNKWVKEA